jgi:hypothetical protein
MRIERGGNRPLEASGSRYQRAAGAANPCPAAARRAYRPEGSRRDPARGLRRGRSLSGAVAAYRRRTRRVRVAPLADRANAHRRRARPRAWTALSHSTRDDGRSGKVRGKDILSPRGAAFTPWVPANAGKYGPFFVFGDRPALRRFHRSQGLCVLACSWRGDPPAVGAPYRKSVQTTENAYALPSLMLTLTGANRPRRMHFASVPR